MCSAAEMSAFLVRRVASVIFTNHGEALELL